MKPTNTVAKLFSSVSTLAVVAGAMALNGMAWGEGVLAWGWNDYGQCSIPAATQSGVSAIAGGDYYTIALKDGAVLAWGAGTTNNGDWPNYGQCIIPASANSGVSAIAGGVYHTIALKDGVVLAWGNNGNGQCLGTDFNGNPITSTPIGEPVKLMGQVLTTVTAIAGGARHTIALKGGAVLAWGAGSPNTGSSFNYGQSIVPAAALSGVTAIAGGGNHTIALKNGAVLAWGNNYYGQCTIPFAAQSGVIAIAGGEQHTIALKGGAVLAWGYNYYGQCIIPAFASSGVSAIAGGGYHTIALTYRDPNDTDDDGIPNATDNCPSMANPTQADCDGNGVGDACELDCNGNGLADVCEIANGTVIDCNRNGIPDSCDIANGVAQDCNNNGVPDSCEILSGAVTDINGNNIPDSCDVVSGLLNDYNHNGIADSAELIIVTTQLAVVTAQLACGDLDGSGDVGSDDLGLLLLNYGTCEGASLTTQQPQEPMIFPMPEAAKPVAVKK